MKWQKVENLYQKQKYAKYELCKKICTENLPLPQTVPGKFGTIQFGNRTIWYWTIWHQANMAPWQYSTRQFGTRTIWHQDNLAPGQFGCSWKVPGSQIPIIIWHMASYSLYTLSKNPVHPQLVTLKPWLTTPLTRFDAGQMLLFQEQCSLRKPLFSIKVVKLRYMQQKNDEKTTFYSFCNASKFLWQGKFALGWLKFVVNNLLIKSKMSSEKVLVSVLLVRRWSVSVQNVPREFLIHCPTPPHKAQKINSLKGSCWISLKALKAFTSNSDQVDDKYSNFQCP